VSLVKVVEVPRRPVSLLEPIIGEQRYLNLIETADQVRRQLAGRTIWNVNSTATGGGVAEMLQVLCGYVSDVGIPISWLVVTGDAEFFAITKRLHNQIHGARAGGPLDAADAHHYTRMLTANAVELLGRIQPGDVALLHDPQTAGLAEPLARAGARVVWRCHIGVGWENDATRAGWDFLRPHLGAAEAYVFSRREYVPSWLPDDKVSIIPPSIDPFSPKNQDLDAATVQAILATLGVLDGATPRVPGGFVRRNGEEGTVARQAVVTGEGRPGPGDPVLLQVSRWDLQRHATVIAQKSLAEGFGLTVSEGMWKSRPVIGSAVGGIIDQIADGTGILLPDPTDLTAFGRAARLLLDDHAKAARLGQAAHAYVRENYLGDIHLMRYAKLLGTLIAEGSSTQAG